jgi:hypothetical protein
MKRITFRAVLLVALSFLLIPGVAGAQTPKL